MPDNETASRLRKQLKEHAAIAGKIYRNLLVLMHNRDVITMDDIYAKARDSVSEESDPNRGLGRRWDGTERDAVYRLVEKYAARHLTPADIDSVVLAASKMERAQSLEEIANLQGVSFALLKQKVEDYCSLPAQETGGPTHEDRMSVRVALIRKFISDQLEYIGVARHFIRITDFPPIMRRTRGPRGGMGRIGGKAAGMVLARKVLEEHFKKRKTDPAFEIATPETWYLRSDLFQDFVQQNDLMDYYDIKYKPVAEIRKAYPLIREVFKNGQFSPYIMKELRSLLDEAGTCPLIVRSSSLLEDNFGSAFSGKYQSIYVANQGRIEERLNNLVGAIAEVYASTLGPDPILYRHERNLLDYDEQMAVMIQKVVGFRHGDYYLPAWAGVGFSRNEWRWTPRIKREDGLVRIVLGLGTRAVDRVGDDYPRMVPLGMPDLRPESSAEEVFRYAQRFADAVNLKRNRFEKIPLTELLSDTNFPDLYRMVSILDHGMVQSPVTKRVSAPVHSMAVTFDGLLNGPFPALMREILGALEQAYGRPMDLEFAFDGEKLFILQCRPQGQRAESAVAEIPSDIPEDRKIFTANRYVQSGSVLNVEYIVYIDPIDYNRLTTYDEKATVGQIVGRLNHRLEARRFILIGPGRWGSNNIELGVKVQYADIHRTLALLEMARSKGGYTPEVSFGTHFFQDLVEAGIYYLPLYPDEKENEFNEAFLRGAPNILTALLPDAAGFSDTIHVIHVPASTHGLYLHILMNADEERALAYLGEQKK